jgi:hypothetical protein
MSVQRKILRQMAHRQMAAEGIRHPNRPLPKETRDMLNRRDGGKWRDSYFSTNWKAAAAKRSAQVALLDRMRSRRRRKAAART